MFFNGYFIYDNINSKRYNLLFANLNTDRFKQLCNEFEYNTEYYQSLFGHSIHGRKWTDSPLSFDVEILSEYPIERDLSSKIKRWIFNSHDYKKLYDDSKKNNLSKEIVYGELKKCYVECIFINPEEIRKAGNLFGWKCTCILKSPMALQEETCLELKDFSQNVKIDINTDYNGYTYPYLEIKVGNTTPKSNVVIRNITDRNRPMIINSVIADSTLYVDCGVSSIIDSSNNSYYDKLADQKFLRLLQGENELSISGDIDWIKIY